MKLRVLNDKVLVRRLEETEKTPGGLFIPQQHRQQPFECKVLAVGRGRADVAGVRHPPEVSVGDIVLLARWVGTEVELEGEKALVVSEEEIMAVVQSAKEN